MIRIDEIYNNTFWPWFRQNCQGTRMFFCDPPGYTDPEHLFNHGSDDIVETGYVFLHDQEPVDVSLYRALFDKVMLCNTDLNGFYITNNPAIHWATEQDRQIFYKWKSENMDTARESFVDFFTQRPDMFRRFRISNAGALPPGHVIVSERGENVEQLQKEYGWKIHYYFYHGWACLDWFRGYDRAFLIPRARDRQPTRTFMSPNRIVAGKRDHRVLFLYNVFKQGLEHNHLSAPRICPAEQVDITSIAQKYTNVYQDITQVFESASLPRTFAGEDTQNMTSCWLTNFQEAQDSLIYVPTETVYFGRRQHITEKTFKAIALEMPFVLVAPAGSLEYLRSYGFKTFGSVIDESYDSVSNDIERIEKVVALLKDLDGLSIKERQQLHRHMLPMIEHNYNYFYKGAFTDVLWNELNNMLKEFHV